MQIKSDEAVATGRERKRYIAMGIISTRRPEFSTGFNYAPGWTADQLAARGFHLAAGAKRGLIKPADVWYNRDQNRA